MKPTVGRIVHYMTRGSADGKYPPTPFASIITQVNDQPFGESCELVTFGPSGMRFEHDVYEDPSNKPGTWHWPAKQ